MAFATPTLDGLPVFGLVTGCTATPKPVARQRSSFFGIDGELDVFGGRRGFIFAIEGAFEESDILSIQADFAVILSFLGPGTHTYTDTRGNTFENVVFSGALTPDPSGPHITGGGWVQAYRMQMESLL